MAEWIVWWLAPSLGFALMLGLFEWFVGGPPAWLRRVRCPASPPATAPDLARLQADLTRLNRQYRYTEHCGQPLIATRLRALSLAYDDVLCECCRAVDLPPPDRPLQAVDRLETEAALSRAGLRW